KLNHAAVYTSDRKHLKAIIENDLLSRISFKPNDQPVSETEAMDDKDTYSSEYLQKEITTYLERLRKERTALDLQDTDEVTNEMAEEKAHSKKDLDIRVAGAKAKLSRIKGTTDHTKKHQEEEVAKEEANTLHYDELEQNGMQLRKNKQQQSGHESEEQESTSSIHPKKELHLSPLSNNIEKEKMEEYLASLRTSEAKIIENEKVRQQIKIIDSF